MKRLIILAAFVALILPTTALSNSNQLHCTVPNLKGSTVAAATVKLKLNRCRIGVIYRTSVGGIIIGQAFKPGTSLINGHKVFVITGGIKIVTIAVPNPVVAPVAKPQPITINVSNPVTVNIDNSNSNTSNNDNSVDSSNANTSNNDNAVDNVVDTANDVVVTPTNTNENPNAATNAATNGADLTLTEPEPIQLALVQVPVTEQLYQTSTTPTPDTSPLPENVYVTPPTVNSNLPVVAPKRDGSREVRRR